MTTDRKFTQPAMTQALVRQIIALATDRTHEPDQPTILYELFNVFAEPALAALNQSSEGRFQPTWDAVRGHVPERALKLVQAYTDARNDEHAEAVVVAFICGLLAGNPTLVLMGQAPSVVQALDSHVTGRDQ
jgi:hypothetical protein